MSRLLYITLSPVLGSRPQRTSSNESMWPTTWPYSRGTFPASSLKISPDSATRQILPALLKSKPCYVYLTHLTTPYNTRDCIHALSITSPTKTFTRKFVWLLFVHLRSSVNGTIPSLAESIDPRSLCYLSIVWRRFEMGHSRCWLHFQNPRRTSVPLRIQDVTPRSPPRSA